MSGSSGQSELDSDNAVGSAKHVRDQVAAWLGVNDRDKHIDWSVQQERGAPKQYAVRIEIRDRRFSW